MAKPIKEIQKRGRGRPATGRDPPVTVRLPEALIVTIDAKAQSEDTTRAEIMRRLVELGLKKGKR
jgi:hypothetical protein